MMSHNGTWIIVAALPWAAGLLLYALRHLLKQSNRRNPDMEVYHDLQAEARREKLEMAARDHDDAVDRVTQYHADAVAAQTAARTASTAAAAQEAAASALQAAEDAASAAAAALAASRVIDKDAGSPVAADFAARAAQAAEDACAHAEAMRAGEATPP
jgi:hypothetical protein